MLKSMAPLPLFSKPTALASVLMAPAEGFGGAGFDGGGFDGAGFGGAGFSRAGFGTFSILPSLQIVLRSEIRAPISAIGESSSSISARKTLE